MSFLVELPQERYLDDAFKSFSLTSNFDLDNARAMMWMSQLAYETGHRDKVDNVLASWDLSDREFIDNPIDVLPLRTACGIVATGRGATIVALAGTDPLKINDWITNFRSQPSPEDIHTGYQAAVADIWARIGPAIASVAQEKHALFLTGHSLGGALAIVAAERAARELGVRATAVYTFGSPRTGGKTFASAYTPVLGTNTYRLVHGNDLVPTVPPPLSGFRHVGRMIQCRSEGRFDAQTPISSPDEDGPHHSGSLFSSALVELQALASRPRFILLAPGLLEGFIELLPRGIRDHVPTKYLQAVTR